MSWKDQVGEVWVIEWKNFDDNVLLVLGPSHRLDEYRCLDLETGELAAWPCDLFDSDNSSNTRWRLA